MTRVAPAIPSETDLLCESCGYTLNGLPDDGRCPECGQPVQASVEDGRKPSTWEREDHGAAVGAFFKTAFGALVRPTEFFRGLSVRGSTADARAFSWIVLVLIAILFGCSSVGHWILTTGWQSNYWIAGAIGFVASIVLLPSLTAVAAKLTHWEASYRGLRLPLDTVRKCMYYHYVHYLPVAAVILATTAVFVAANEGRIPSIPAVSAGIWYLYVLSAEVIAAAGYLFWTYWIAMRNVMYANR